MGHETLVKLCDDKGYRLALMSYAPVLGAMFLTLDEPGGRSYRVRSASFSIDVARDRTRVIVEAKEEE